VKKDKRLNHDNSKKKWDKGKKGGKTKKNMAAAEGVSPTTEDLENKKNTEGLCKGMGREGDRKPRDAPPRGI